MGYLGRDIEVVRLHKEEWLLVACDSSGGIGSKDLDVVRVPPEVVGRFAARVALLEILAVGGKPQVLTVAVSNEGVPTGEGILKGVREELKVMGFEGLPIAVSTEKNVPTQQTGVGIGVTATADSGLRIGRSRAGDQVFCLGIPKVGEEVADAEDPEMVQGRDIFALLHAQAQVKPPGMQEAEIKGWAQASDQVQAQALSREMLHDLLPVGSQGILKEAEGLADAVACRFESCACPLDLQKSAGPSTCLIVTAPQGSVLAGVVRSSLPITRIGILV